MSTHNFIGATLRRRVTVLMFVAATVLVGAIAWFLIPLELLPSGLVEASASVRIPVPDANPMEVQEQVIRPAEELIRTIPGIKEINSRARPDGARINVSFSRDVDQDLAVAELRDRLERARVSWPEEVREYYIGRFNLDTDLPIFSFAIYVDQKTDELAFLIDELVVKRLEAVPGVARTTAWGLLRDQIRIRVDREKLQALGMGIYDLTKTLQQSNLEVTGGEIEQDGFRYTLKTDARFRSLEDIRNFPINRQGVRLAQVADVENAKAVEEFVVLSRNQLSLWLQIYKESSANTVDTGRRVREILENRISKEPRLKELGVRFRYFDDMDFGSVITGSLETLRTTALWGALLALLVLFYFLRRLSLTLIITLSIPLSLMITLAGLYFGGSSLNLLSMMGITVAIGMLIDNSIVVVENITRYRDEGMPAMAAARLGASEVALAITLSTLTTVAAFLPIIFMSGGQQMTFFLSGIGLPLCAAVSCSLLVALFFIPLGTVVLYKPGASTRQAGWRKSWVLDRIRVAYAASLGWVLKNRLYALLAVVSLMVGLTLGAWESLPKTNIMSDSGGRVEIRVKLDGNFALLDALDTFRHYGDFLLKNMEKYEIEHFWCFFRKDGGRLSLDLTHNDIKKTRDLTKLLQKELPETPGVKISLSVDDGSQERGKLSLDIYGPDPRELVRIANEVSELVERVPGILSVDSELAEAEEEVWVTPDREKTARYGIDARAFRGTISYGVRGFRFSDLVMGDQEIPLIIEYEGAEDRDLPELKDLPIMAEGGQQIPLGQVANVEVHRGFGEIHRTNGQIRAQLTLHASEENQRAVATRVREAVDGYALPQGYRFHEAQGEDVAEAMAEMKGAIILSVVFVFLLMGILFESFILPFAVIVAVPFSWAGAVWGLALTQTPLDFVGAIGIIVLVGVVVNNGIVLIDCAQQCRRSGSARNDALVEAGTTRFRPILMTAGTTVVGLLPMAVSTATGSQISYTALSRVIIGGLLVSTFLTLFFVPILYSILDDLRNFTGRVVRSAIPATAD